MVGEVRVDNLWATLPHDVWLLAATDNGLAYFSKATGRWSLMSVPNGDGPGIGSVSYSAAGRPTLYATADNGSVYKIDLSGPMPVWAKTMVRFNTVAVDPHNSQHIIGTALGIGGPDDYKMFESWNGGGTATKLSDELAYYVAFDPRDATSRNLWRGGQGGVHHSTDGGHSWNQPQWIVRSRDGYYFNRTSNDVQHLIMDFGGVPAFCSDQGLTKYSAANDTLVSVGGDMKSSIVVSAAAIRTPTGSRNVLTTMWDWGPTASWDDGASWQATSWYGSYYWAGLFGTGAPAMGEGGQVVVSPPGPDANLHVLISDAGRQIFYSDDAGKHFGVSALSAPSSGLTLSILQNSITWSTDSAGHGTGRVFLAAVTNDASGNNVGTWVYQSLDFGHNWAALKSNLSASQAPVFLTISPTDPNKLLAGSGGCVFSLSLSSGVSGGWSTCNQVTSSGENVDAVAVNQVSGAMVVSTDAGTLYSSTDGGKRWIAWSLSTLIQSRLTGSTNLVLKFSPSGKTIAIASAKRDPGAVGKFVIASHDFGKTWLDLTSDIVSVQFNHMSWEGSDLYLATSGEGLLKAQNVDIMN